jgi:hypothetical protein
MIHGTGKAIVCLGLPWYGVTLCDLSCCLKAVCCAVLRSEGEKSRKVWVSSGT